MMDQNTFWSVSYKRCSSQLLAMCVRYVQDRALAEDLMHEGFIRAIDKYQTFSGSGSFDGWLRKIVVNTVLMHLRKQRLLYFVKLEGLDVMDNDESDDNNTKSPERKLIEDAKFSQQDLLILLHELPDHYRIVFNLYVIDGYKHAEIATMLNIAVGTSKSNLARARKKIAEVLYKKALGKKKEKESHVILLYLPMLFVDGIFKEAFAGERIAPKKMSGSLEAKIQSVSSKSDLTRGLQTYLRMAYIGGGAIAVTVITWLALTPNPEMNSGVPLKIQPADSLLSRPVNQMQQLIHDSIPKKDSNTDLTSPTARTGPPKDTIHPIIKKPIIVKKKIILRDTVFVKKNNTEQ